MKIFTRLVTDWDGNVLEEESFDYEGPIAHCGSGGSQTTVVQPQPTAAQTALTQKQVELAEAQLQAIQSQTELQAQFGEELGPLLEFQTAEAQRAAEEQERLGPIREELLQLSLEDLRRGGAATEEEIRLIEGATGAAQTAGEVDIERFETMGLRGLREELAPSLGLRPGDTPILDRGSMLAAEALRQRGQLSAGLGQVGAQARLNFPLARSQFFQTTAQSQQSLQEATRQFQEQLRQQAFMNRLGAMKTVGGLGLGLATGVSPSFNLGPMGSTQTTQSSQSLGLSGVASILGGIGGFLGGLSSKEAKTDKTEIDEEKVLEKVEELPVEAWRYKGDTEPHIGTYAEDFQEAFGLGDGKMLNLMDVTGVLTASVKALSKKVKEHDRRFGLTTA